MKLAAEAFTAAAIMTFPIWGTWGYYWLTGLQMRF